MQIVSSVWCKVTMDSISWIINAWNNKALIQAAHSCKNSNKIIVSTSFTEISLAMLLNAIQSRESAAGGGMGRPADPMAVS